MMRAAFLLLFAITSAAHAEPGEDAAHRADRLRTAELNRGVAVSVGRRGRRDPASQESYQAARARYAQDREDYERELADWRRRVGACRAGDWDACR